MHRVRPNGCIEWGGEELFVSEALAGERIGISQMIPQAPDSGPPAGAARGSAAGTGDGKDARSALRAHFGR